MAEIKPEAPQWSYPVWFAFLHIEELDDGNKFQFQCLPILCPADISVDMPMQVGANAGLVCNLLQVNKEKDKKLESDMSWMNYFFKNVLSVVFAPLLTAARDFSRASVVETIDAVRQQCPNVKFIVRDSQVPIAALNSILAAQGREEVHALLFTDVRLRIPLHLRQPPNGVVAARLRGIQATG